MNCVAQEDRVARCRTGIRLSMICKAAEHMERSQSGIRARERQHVLDRIARQTIKAIYGKGAVDPIRSVDRALLIGVTLTQHSGEPGRLELPPGFDTWLFKITAAADLLNCALA